MNRYRRVLDREAASEVGTDRRHSADAGGRHLRRQHRLRHLTTVAAVADGEPRVAEAGGAARVPRPRTVRVVGEVHAEAGGAAGNRPAPVRGRQAQVRAPAAMAVEVAAEDTERGHQVVARAGAVGRALVGQAAATEADMTVNQCRRAGSEKNAL